ncbi:MAG TPA: response regulator [Roseiflexaceae bacterium]|nr:response regulator [Roseiflexaceae bacterium]
MPQQPVQCVLVVEDDQEIAAAVAAALTAGGLRVWRCAGAEEALGALAGFEADVVLLDVLLPGGQAQRLVAAMRADERFRATPLVFITGRGAAHATGQFTALQALAALPGLFDPVTRSTTTAAIWEHWAGEKATEVGG